MFHGMQLRFDGPVSYPNGVIYVRNKDTSMHVQQSFAVVTLLYHQFDRVG